MVFAKVVFVTTSSLLFDKSRVEELRVASVAVEFCSVSSVDSESSAVEDEQEAKKNAKQSSETVAHTVVKNIKDFLSINYLYEKYAV